MKLKGEGFSVIIKILGSGCSNCKKLEANVRQAIEELKIEATVEKVTDIEAMMAYGIMSTPALVVDGQVRLSGRVPSPEDLKKYLD